MRRLDGWIIARVESALKWLDDWLGLSQSRIEKALIVLYGLSRVAFALMCHDGRVRWAEICITSAVVGCMFVGHRMPQSLRGVLRGSIFLLFIRVSSVALLPSSIYTVVSGASWGMVSLVADITYTAFFYVLVASISGERQGRAKLSWSRIKELFGGASWIPVPQEG